jgi:ceramide glucosyltransferase
MPDLADSLLVFVVLAAALHVATALSAAVRCWRHPPDRTTELPAVTILRPVCGLDQHDALTLGSTFELDYPRYDIVFCAAHANDAGARLAQQLIARYPDVPARLLVGDDRVSPNPKLNNLVKGWQAETAAWVVMADSNVLMPPDYLQRLFAAWTPGTGLVCSPPVGSLPDTFMAEVEAGFLNTFQARWQLAADTAGFGFAQGKSMLWHRPLLDAAGGMAALAHELAEDAAATKIVRRAGRQVRLTAAPFPQPLGARSAQQVWDRQLRWARLRRMTFPVAFTPEILCGLLPPLAALMAWSHLSDTSTVPSALALAATWYGVEALLAAAAGWHLSWRSPAAWLLRDTLLPLLWVAAVAGSALTWRGTDLTPARSG